MVGQSIMAYAKQGGLRSVHLWITDLLDQVNQACGTVMEPRTLAMCADMIYDRFKGRSPDALRMALRDGLNNGGKLYGKLTYPVIAGWLDEHEAKVEELAYQEHIRTK